MAEITERLLKNLQQNERKQEQISDEIAINSELTQLRKQGLLKSLTQSKRIRDTRTKLMLEQELNNMPTIQPFHFSLLQEKSL